MAKSHKLLVAVALLAGGYSLALVWNATANFFWPTAALMSGDDSRAALALGSSALIAPTATSGVQLVPANMANPLASRNSPASGTTTGASGGGVNSLSVAQNPTWLSAGPQTSANNVATNSHSPGAQNSPGEIRSDDVSNGDPAGTNDERGIPTVTPFPTAQITAVKPVDNSAAATASPWDRWPRWEPAAATSSAIAPDLSVEVAGEPANRVSAAIVEQLDTPSASPAAIQTSFNASSPYPVVGRQVNRLLPVPQPLAQDDEQDNEPRTHTIVDGDSLAKLAERFLGDAKLSSQIYDLNRDVLASPDLLPIGAELKLPTRQLTAMNRAAAMPSGGLTATGNPPGMIPVEDVRKAFVGMPRAQLLRPLPPTEESKSSATSASYAANGD